jgi:hypothetical protein
MEPDRRAFLQAMAGRAAAVAAAATAMRSSAQAQAGAAIISFAPGASNGLPGGFSIARTGKGMPPVWAVIADATVPGGYVLAQTSADNTDYRFPLAIYDPISAVNLDVSVRFKAVGGHNDRAGGLAIRLLDAENYYVVRANALEDNVNFYRVVQGSRREITGVSAKVASDAWHSLGLKAEGDKFTISFDGKILFTATDRTFKGAGKVALWTKADSVTHFDALAITAR